MFIITFFSMILIISATYIVQFVMMHLWIIDYEKHNTKDIYKQIYTSFYHNNFEVNDYLVYFRPDETDIWVYDEDKSILISTDDIPDGLIVSKLPSKLEIHSKRIDDEEKIILNAPLYFGDKTYYIYIEKEIEIYEDLKDSIIPIIIISIISITIMSLIASTYVSRKFVNKLKALKVTMEKVKDKGVSTRVKILNENDEFDKIGILFNSMMDEVENSFNQQQQFVHDASHELRTPLTILKGHLQMLNRWGKNDKDTLDKSLEIASNELERLIKLVNDLLNLNRMENYKIEDKDPEYVNVNSVIDEVIYGFNILSEDINIVFNSNGEVCLKMTHEHLKQLIIIFIDNSIKYCDKDKKYIDIRLWEKDNKVFISIKDNGIGIKSEDIPKVTDKFYRADASRKYNNSFGIGLSIASNLVKLYKGELKILSEYGVYTEVIVSFQK